jgi:hypothetical protein
MAKWWFAELPIGLNGLHERMETAQVTKCQMQSLVLVDYFKVVHASLADSVPDKITANEVEAGDRSPVSRERKSRIHLPPHA